MTTAELNRRRRTSGHPSIEELRSIEGMVAPAPPKIRASRYVPYGDKSASMKAYHARKREAKNANKNSQ